MPVDYAASVQGISIRVTRLDESGNLLAGQMDSYTTSSFLRTSFTPEYESGDEITEKAADGTVCVSFQAPDTLKRVTMEIAICDPDPELSALLSGGLLLSDMDAQGNEVSLGWASAQVGEDPSGFGVAVEVWSRAIQNGKPAGTNPYFHWIFPYVKTRLSGDRVIENGLLATTFEGFGLGNINFRSGPDATWRWPAATDRPYLYARSPWAPQGLRGFYTWVPGTPAVPGVGTPGDVGFVPPVPAGAPLSGAPSVTLDDQVKAGFNVNNGGTLYPKDSSLPEDRILSAYDYLPDASGTIDYPAAATSNPVRNISPTGQPPVTYKVRQGGAVTPYPNATVLPTPTMPVPTGEVTVAWGASPPASRLDLTGFTFPPGTPAFAPGNYVEVGPDEFYWNGAAWAPGRSPDAGYTSRPDVTYPTRSDVWDGDAFTGSNFSVISASDSANAAKISNNATNIYLTPNVKTAWASGDGILVNSFAFHWAGTAWAAGDTP